MSIWKDSQGITYCKRLDLEPWIIVELNTCQVPEIWLKAGKSMILEALLEDSKPSIINNKHYLIFTPFRYPPLKHGSRFGTTYEPSLWYGSLSLKTAFAEVAFYRLTLSLIVHAFKSD